MTKPTVLIIADDVDFSRTLISRWQSERTVPAFTVVGSAVWAGCSGDYDVAVIGALPAAVFYPILTNLDANAAVRPAICVCNDQASLQQVRESFPRVLAMRRHEDWIDSLVLLGSEALRRVELAARCRQSEETAAATQHHAALGRYILDMRHGLNNALTSVLGNSELLLLEPDALSSDIRDQIDTIRSMALRMHEILQRFSSLEAEMHFAEKQSQSETQAQVRRYAAGS